MYENILRHPGPTPIPKRVERAMTENIISHRTPEFVALYEETVALTKPLFGTTQDILFLPSGGTAALEAAAVNTVSAGEDVVIVTTGAFGDYFVAICEQYNFRLHKLEIPWGQACTADDLQKFLKNVPNAKAVFLTYNETSTGILNPIEQLAKVVHEHSDALIIVDGVSCIGGVKPKMDDWGIDILVTGSQKALMLPPGLAIIAVSQKAWSVIEKNNTPVYYLNLLTYKNWAEKGMTPNTPAITLLFGLREVGRMIQEEGGIEHTAKRHVLMKNMVRAAMNALHIELLTGENYASPTVTAIKAPENIALTDFVAHLKKEYYIDFAGGLGPLKGEIFRFGHMGYCFPSDILQAISHIEATLQDFNYDMTAGAGVLAAQKVFLEST